MRTRTLLLATLAGAPGAVAGLLTTVEATGTVASNAVFDPPLGLVAPGDAARLTMTLDASDFVEGPGGTTRAYRVQSLSLMLGAQTLAMQSPMPLGVETYFVVRNGAPGAPGADGFFVGTSTTTANGAPLNIAGSLGQFRAVLDARYDGSVLDSADILGAVGAYAGEGLTQVQFFVADGPTQPLILNFNDLRITVVPGPGAALAMAGAMALAGVRRRR
ncbi:MAG: hypothetical protein IBJ10_04115 [Phycisphaerales bacterium]|nr:hypothetical protein [Phycisphaerales bacterium]